MLHVVGDGHASKREHGVYEASPLLPRDEAEFERRPDALIHGPPAHIEAALHRLVYLRLSARHTGVQPYDEEQTRRSGGLIEDAELTHVSADGYEGWRQEESGVAFSRNDVQQMPRGFRGHTPRPLMTPGFSGWGEEPHDEAVDVGFQQHIRGTLI